MNNTMDMTKGRPLPLIMRFALPIMLTSVLQQLYSLADGVIVGRYLGITAFAAIGAAGFIAWLPQNMLLGLSHGFGAVLSQLFGAGDRAEFRRGNVRAGVLSGLIALVFTIPLILFREELLALLRTPAELRQYASDYLLIIYIGLPFFALFNWAASALRAMGDSRTPLIAMLLSSVINIVLDFVLIKLIPLGVVGPALSTVIAQVISFVHCVAALLIKKPDFPACNGTKVDGSIRRMLYMGFPPMLRDCVISVGGLYVQSVVNSFGVAFVAGMTAANRYFSIISMSGGSLEGAVATFSGQNAGAGKYGRIRRGVFSALLLTLGMAAASMLVFWFAAPWLICMITGEAETEALRMGIYALRCSIVFLPALHLLFLYRAAIQGMGSAVTPMLSGFAELAMRIFSVCCLTAYIGYTSACIADGLGWVLAVIPLAARYVILIRKYDK